MFRAELKQLTDGSILKMEGRLVGEWANEAKSLVLRGPAPKRLIVDLTEVSYIDAVGEQVLQWFRSLGATFVAPAVYAAATCRRLSLPLQTKPVTAKPVYRGVLIAQEGTDQ